MDFRHLRYFLAVAESRSFTRAAATLRVAQPALSRQIRDLEQELGVQLFHRSARGAVLTEAGMAFLPDASSLLVQSEQARNKLRRYAADAVHRLHIAYSVGLFHSHITPFVERIRALRPGVEFSLYDLDAVTQVEWLQEGKLDIGLLGFPPTLDLSESLDLHPFGSCTFMAVLPERHPLAGEPSLELRRLAGESFVWLCRKRHPWSAHAMLQICTQAGFRPNIAATGERGQLLLNMIACGMGIGLAPDLSMALPHPGVVFVPLRDVGARPLVAACRKGGFFPAFLGPDPGRSLSAGR